MFNAMLGYYSAIQVYAKINGKQADKTKAIFIPNAEAEGWLNAGRYFWDVMRFNASSAKAMNLSKYVAPAISPSWPSPMPTKLNKIVTGAGTALTSYALASPAAISTGFQAYITSVYGTMGNGVYGGKTGGTLGHGGGAAAVAAIGGALDFGLGAGVGAAIGQKIFANLSKPIRGGAAAGVIAPT